MRCRVKVYPVPFALRTLRQHTLYAWPAAIADTAKFIGFVARLTLEGPIHKTQQRSPDIGCVALSPTSNDPPMSDPRGPAAR